MNRKISSSAISLLMIVLALISIPVGLFVIGSYSDSMRPFLFLWFSPPIFGIVSLIFAVFEKKRKKLKKILIILDILLISWLAIFPAWLFTWLFTGFIEFMNAY